MSKNRGRRPKYLLTAVACLLMAAAWGYTDPAGAEVPDRLKRQINVLEEVIDEVLIDSPYLLIFGSDPTHGIYLDAFGVVFTLEASLVDKEFDWGEFPWLGNKYRIESEDGKIIIWRDDPDDKEEGEGSVVLDEEEWLDEQLAHEKETYDHGKQELIDALADYGETLTALDDNQWVAIASFLRDSEYFTERKISRMILKVKMSDLRAHAQDKLSRDELMARVQVEEY